MKERKYEGEKKGKKERKKKKKEGKGRRKREKKNKERKKKERKKEKEKVHLIRFRSSLCFLPSLCPGFSQNEGEQCGCAICSYDAYVYVQWT
jgi:hypothetical protein